MSFGSMKPDIEYPCPWVYKIIGTAEGELRAAVAALITESHTLALSKTSKKGKYTSLNLTINVMDEAHRDAIYARLSGSPKIKMVM
jgi:putative lipoic acid-binding regulatory protein